MGSRQVVVQTIFVSTANHSSFQQFIDSTDIEHASPISTLTLAAIAILFGCWLVVKPRANSSHEHADFWTKLDVVGLPSGPFPWTRALVQSLTSMQKNAHEGYMKISKLKDLPFALPTTLTQGAVVVLPPSLLHLLNKRESEVRAFESLLDTLQLPYVISDRDVYMNPIHFDVVRKHMISGKDIDALASPTAEEIDVSFRDIWGTSNQWTSVNGWDVCGRIIARAATRVLIGLPTSRDEAFFEPARLFSDSVMLSTALLNCLPPVVRPVVGPLVALRAKYYRNRCLKILVPFVERRIEMWKNDEKEEDMPNDFLQWMIPKSAKEGPEQLNAVKLATRLMTINVMFVVAMAYVFAHAVIDIYSNPSKEYIIGSLEEECRRVSNEYGGLSSKRAVDRLYRLDSAIRESMRLSDVAVTALPRDIVSDNFDVGNDIQIPRGTRVVFPTQPIHQDPDYYENPLQYDPFRFSRKFESESEKDSATTPTSERESLTTVTDSFLAFGYGRHACPGRHWTAQTMKQALASLVLNYDVEVIKKPEKRQVLLNMMVPPVDIQFRIRRKG